MRNAGISFNAKLASSTSFNNPRMMSKLIDYFELNEYGSGFEKQFYDPNGFPEEAYYDAISAYQKEKVNKSIKEGHSKRTIEFK